MIISVVPEKTADLWCRARQLGGWLRYLYIFMNKNLVTQQVGERRNKLSTLVRFPLTGLDMAPHLVKRSQSMRNLNMGPWPPAWKQPSGQHPDMTLPHDYQYDLYAVCNHHGGMHGGHYTGVELV